MNVHEKHILAAVFMRFLRQKHDDEFEKLWYDMA